MKHENLCDQLPVAKRALGFRIYGTDGRRYLDLWQDGGFALLGHRPGRLTVELKNVISKGLIAPLPSVYTRRLKRQLQKLYPSHRNIGFLSGLTGNLTVKTRISDPALGQSGSIAFARPFLDTPDSDSLIPIIPFRWGDGPVVICSRERNPVQTSTCLSPILAAGMIWSLHELNRFTAPDWFQDGFIDKESPWKQRGPYIAPRFDEEEYPEVFRAFLEEDVVLSPRYSVPSILPGSASTGEITKVHRLFERFPGQ